jgi:K+-transporting ATPase ATPase C chain
MKSLIASLRLTLATLVICSGGYTLVIWGVGRIFTPDTAEGSLITRADGTVVGSRLIAQKFTQPKYFWPRPSAVDYNASGAGGSNKSPTSLDLTKRAMTATAAFEATGTNPVPAELVAASGGGLDPHISIHGARYQAPRIAHARGVSQAEIEKLIESMSFSPGGFLTPDRLVNVLELNLALDRELGDRTSAAPVAGS